MTKSRCWLVGLAIAICGGTAWADDEPDSLLAGKLLSVKPGSLVRFVAKGTIPMPSAANDPTAAGASLLVFDTSDAGAGSNTYELPAAGWQALGSPAGSLGFRYKGGPADPCRTVLLKPTVVKAICKGAAVTLTPPFTDSVGVVLTVGNASKRYCASFGGTELKNAAGLTKRKNAPAPASCPTGTFGAPICTLASTSSETGFPFAGFPAVSISSGTITLTCGAIGVNGSASCTCDLGSVAPIIFPSIGELCITDAGSCPSGAIDCDGGDPHGIDLIADHDIGACASSADCAAACGTVCGGFGATYEVRASSCEGFCVGGGNDGAACTTTTQCPGGSCAGADGGGSVHAGRCNCQCGGSALGAASPPGTLACNLGVRFTFEAGANGVCGDKIPSIDSGPMCLPLTTATSTSVLENANHNAGQTIPSGGADTSTGTPLACATVAGGNLAGLNLVGAFALFEHQVTGDLLSRSSFVCQ